MSISLAAAKNLSVRFERGFLHPRQWNHRTRLVLGLWHILSPVDHDAVAAMREGIIACNAAAESVKRVCLYDEAVTVFYLKRIEAFAAAYPCTLDFKGIVEALLRSDAANPNLHRASHPTDCRLPPGLGAKAAEGALAGERRRRRAAPRICRKPRSVYVQVA